MIRNVLCKALMQRGGEGMLQGYWNLRILKFSFVYMRTTRSNVKAVTEVSDQSQLPTGAPLGVQRSLGL